MPKHSSGPERPNITDFISGLTMKASDRKVRSGHVRYMDGSTLRRPLSLPRKMWPFLAVILVVAAVLGFRYAYKVDYNILHHSERVQEQVQAQLERDVSQDVPQLTSYANLDDAAILQSMSDAGFTYVDMNEINGTGDASIDVIKLPSDMSATEAALAYTSGVSQLDNLTAARFLSGSWRFMAMHDSGTSYTVRYADFSSGSAQAAVDAAVSAQGFAESNLGDAGIDDNGNTFQRGTIDLDGSSWEWSVSACSLSDVYSVTGLPDDAQYVGVRLTAY